MSDRAVPWQMCVVPGSVSSENILVSAPATASSPDHPKMRADIVDRLAQPQQEWRPHAPR